MAERSSSSTACTSGSRADSSTRVFHSPQVGQRPDPLGRGGPAVDTAVASDGLAMAAMVGTGCDRWRPWCADRGCSRPPIVHLALRPPRRTPPRHPPRPATLRRIRSGRSGPRNGRTPRHQVTGGSQYRIGAHRSAPPGSAGGPPGAGPGSVRLGAGAGQLHRRRLHALDGRKVSCCSPATSGGAPFTSKAAAWSRRDGLHVDHDGLAHAELLPQDALRQRVLDHLLDGPAQRPCAQLGS